ncbi:MAG: RraA family protein [Sphaerochaeta sp.]|uniref:RraA family protein n=1 Tax=Sphaerochaeta sp. TaxID=1972642 RepID=UPI002FCAF9EB
MQYLTKEQLEELRQFDTPTVCNALEKFKLRSKTEGFTSPIIKAVYPDRKPVVGYACTAKVSARYPGTRDQEEILYRYYQSILDCPSTPISVIQDIDEHPVGSFWGEVQTTVHKALGCMAVVTNGGVRDLDEAYQLGFTYFASCTLVSHAYIHMEQTGTPVEVGGLIVRPGDLIHADKHGAVLIPNEVADQVAAACRQMQNAELPVLNGCRATADGTLNLADLRIWRAEMAELRKK